MDYENEFNNCMENYNEDVVYELQQVEKEYEEWDMLSRKFVNIENEYEEENISMYHSIERMKEICGSQDKGLFSLWEEKQHLISGINKYSKEFRDEFDYESSNIKKNYENRINELYNNINR